MVYYELENNTDRLQQIRGILERNSIECKHYNDNMSFIKSEVGPADLEKLKFEFLSGKECLFISKLVFNAGFGRAPESEVINWVSEHNDEEFNDFYTKAASALINNK